ncbi:MAG: T9SS type A sorting domain-containing protein [Phaeodactylibacter sp.]|nr:T9SS type A sorting domain-containing protein [Phaeodactylibacter sp.]
MKTILLAAQLCLPLSLFAQYFQEICPGTTTNGTLVNFAEQDGTIYATGFFTEICDTPTDYIALWNGSEWEAAEWGLTKPGHALRNINNQLYIAQYQEGLDSNWVYVLENGIPQKLGSGVFLTTASGLSQVANLYDIIEYNGRLFACGEFDRVGNENISGIMQWDGQNWTSVGLGLGSNIPGTAPVMYPHQMLVFNGELIVAGNFGKAGGLPANGIARWNGEEWAVMGSGFNSTVYALGVYKDELYAGGYFTMSNDGSTEFKAIAKWNGTEWVSPGFGFTNTNLNDYTFVHSFLERNDLLYIAGGLKTVEYDGGQLEPCGGIVTFDGATVDVLDGGVEGNDIEALIFTEAGDLLVGGGVFGTGYSGRRDINAATFRPERPDLVLAPNPASTQLQITGMEAADFPITVQIYDHLGRLIVRQELRQPAITIEDLQPGVYFLEITDALYSGTFKFIRQ